MCFCSDADTSVITRHLVLVTYDTEIRISFWRKWAPLTAWAQIWLEFFAGFVIQLAILYNLNSGGSLNYMQ